jgi:hypothetical protein
MRIPELRNVTAGAGVAAILALSLLALPAQAADPVFPPGSRIGLVPPPGMIESKAFLGFEDPTKNAAIVLTTLPAPAYAEIEKTAATDVLKKQGITVEKHEPIQLGIGNGFLIVGTQTADNAHYRKWLLVIGTSDLTALVSAQIPDQDTTYKDDVIRAALKTLAARATVPDAERLGLLPFTVGNLAGFHIEDVLPGRALMLVDVPDSASTGTGGVALNARLLVAAMPGGPAETDDRSHFARLAFDEIGGIKDIQITMSEPLRIGGQQGFQTVAQAKDVHTGEDVMVVQWLRFGNGAFMQMIGIARADHWTDELTRLRAVRDSIDPK